MGDMDGGWGYMDGVVDMDWGTGGRYGWGGGIWHIFLNGGSFRNRGGTVSFTN